MIHAIKLLTSSIVTVSKCEVCHTNCDFSACITTTSRLAREQPFQSLHVCVLLSPVK